MDIANIGITTLDLVPTKIGRIVMQDHGILQEILTSAVPEISLFQFVLNIFLAAALAYGVGLIYVKYGTALSNRRAFAHNFVLVAVTTMLVISIVKSSLALSLGLIGALSIVRFRAAIKDPEELSYLFLAIAIGLGLGANQRLITIVTILIVLAILVVRRSVSRDHAQDWEQDLYLTVSTNNPDELTLEKIIETVNNHVEKCLLRRADSHAGGLEVTFLVELPERQVIQLIETSFRRIDDQMKLTFLESR